MKRALPQAADARNKKQKIRKFIFEFRRKLVHIFVGSFLSFLIYKDFYFLPICLILIFGGAVLAFLIKKEKKIPFLYNFIVSFERKKEIEKFPMKGALLFLFGCLLSYLIFAFWLGFKIIAIGGILTLSFGDSFVALYGTLLGKIKSPIDEQKHLDATILGVIFNTILLLFILRAPLAKVFLASFLALFCEIFVPFEKIEKKPLGFIFDDNIFIPLIFGIVLFSVY